MAKSRGKGAGKGKSKRGGLNKARISIKINEMMAIPEDAEIDFSRLTDDDIVRLQELFTTPQGVVDMTAAMLYGLVPEQARGLFENAKTGLDVIKMFLDYAPGLMEGKFGKADPSKKWAPGGLALLLAKRGGSWAMQKFGGKFLEEASKPKALPAAEEEEEQEPELSKPRQVQAQAPAKSPVPSADTEGMSPAEIEQFERAKALLALKEMEMEATAAQVEQVPKQEASVSDKSDGVATAPNEAFSRMFTQKIPVPKDDEEDK
jgi:hypothetical protein